MNRAYCPSSVVKQLSLFTNLDEPVLTLADYPSNSTPADFYSTVQSAMANGDQEGGASDGAPCQVLLRGHAFSSRAAGTHQPPHTLRLLANLTEASRIPAQPPAVVGSVWPTPTAILDAGDGQAHLGASSRNFGLSPNPPKG